MRKKDCLGRMWQRAKVLSPVAHKLVWMDFFTDGRKDPDLKRTIWTIGDGWAYAIDRNKGAVKLNMKYDEVGG